jgi:leucine-zipper of insertion element IS481
MSKERVIVLSVVQQHLSKAETARRYNISWRWVHTLVTRYQSCGWEAVEAQSRRPHRNSRAVNDELRQRICTLRCELQAAGLDRPGLNCGTAAARRPPGASVLHDPPHPHRRRLDHPGTEEAA